MRKLVYITQLNNEKRLIGYIDEDKKIFVSIPRKQNKHLYRGGCKTLKEARKLGVSAWG